MIFTIIWSAYRILGKMFPQVLQIIIEFPECSQRLNELSRKKKLNHDTKYEAIINKKYS
jgi:hypothetical protein